MGRHTSGSLVCVEKAEALVDTDTSFPRKVIIKDDCLFIQIVLQLTVSEAEKFVLFFSKAIDKWNVEKKDGVLMQYQLDKILENESGRQLLAEALTFFGFLLLLMEHRMSGVLREKLLVAHLRFDHCSDRLNLENLCKLCRLHPFSSSPPCQDDLVSFMIVVPLSEKIVDAIICHIRDGDLYRCLRHYPDPQHRTVALSPQAGYLYVLLLYSPESLQNGFLMREIVDRFFRDCWVCPIFLYFSVDLSVSWDAHREAKMALSSYLSSTFVSDRTQLSCTKVKEALSELDSVLSDGVLTKNYVLENSHHLISLSIDKKLRDIVTSVLSAHQIGDETLLLLLLKISRLEFEMKCFYSKLLEGREASWHDSKHCASDRMKEISHFFSGSWASSYKMKSESLENMVQSLDYSRARNSEKKLYHILSALKDVEQDHQVEENQPIRRTISEIQQYLQDMLKALNVGDDTLCTFSTITGSIYAWSFIEKFFALLRKKIEQDSLVVLNLHYFFLKFSPLLDAPMSRISRSKRKKQGNKTSITASQRRYQKWENKENFWCSYCKKKRHTRENCWKLHGQPPQQGRAYYFLFDVILNFQQDDLVMIFRIFNEDTLHDLQPLNLPSCVEIANLKDLVQPEEQSNLMEAVNKISIFSRGMLLMSRHLSGLIQLDLKNWTERQISMELLRQLEDKSKSFFISTIVEPEEFEVNMKKLTSYVLSQQHMMECLQDFLHIRGNQIWNEVLSDFLKDSAQQCGVILMEKFGHQYGIKDSQSEFRDCRIDKLGFITVLCHQGEFGKYIKWRNKCGKLNQKNMEELCKLDKALGPAVSLPLLGWLPYQPMLKSFSTSCQPWAESLATVGQLQLLRHMISLKLNSSCKHSLTLLNNMVVEREKFRIAWNLERIIRELFFQVMNNEGTILAVSLPLATSTCAKILLLSYADLSQYVFDPHLGTLICQMKKATDFSPMLLMTFPINIRRNSDILYMGQYVRTIAGTAGISSEPAIDPESEVTKSTFWLMNFCKHMEIPKDMLDSCLPPSLFPVLQT
ncbi:unnamed protein product [Spirodela intermedia]|uniref:Uncharacterized protein n=1 Tax=Spirodela intermedia TaxID=51605 RepID=A0A7I8JDM4_SPIIN|nr:unnamed protein product [Spirodela intermedia]CAA6667825.1 unnamed protein product [Spirodela intermedia]